MQTLLKNLFNSMNFKPSICFFSSCAPLPLFFFFKSFLSHHAISEIFALFNAGLIESIYTEECPCKGCRYFKEVE